MRTKTKRITIRVSEEEFKYLEAIARNFSNPPNISEAVRFLIHQSILLTVFNSEEISELKQIVLKYMAEENLGS